MMAVNLSINFFFIDWPRYLSARNHVDFQNS